MTTTSVKKARIESHLASLNIDALLFCFATNEKERLAFNFLQNKYSLNESKMFFFFS
jgi:hypothetical protein